MRDFFDPFLISLLPSAFLSHSSQLHQESCRRIEPIPLLNRSRAKVVSTSDALLLLITLMMLTGSVWDFPNDCGDIGLLLSLLGPSAFLS